MLPLRCRVFSSGNKLNRMKLNRQLYWRDKFHDYSRFRLCVPSSSLTTTISTQPKGPEIENTDRPQYSTDTSIWTRRHKTDSVPKTREISGNPEKRFAKALSSLRYMKTPYPYEDDIHFQATDYFTQLRLHVWQVMEAKKKISSMTKQGTANTTHSSREDKHNITSPTSFSSTRAPPSTSSSTRSARARATWTDIASNRTDVLSDEHALIADALEYASYNEVSSQTFIKVLLPIVSKPLPFDSLDRMLSTLIACNKQRSAFDLARYMMKWYRDMIVPPIASSGTSSGAPDHTYHPHTFENIIVCAANAKEWATLREWCDISLLKAYLSLQSLPSSSEPISSSSTSQALNARKNFHFQSQQEDFRHFTTHKMLTYVLEAAVQANDACAANNARTASAVSDEENSKSLANIIRLIDVIVQHRVEVQAREINNLLQRGFIYLENAISDIHKRSENQVLASSNSTFPHSSVAQGIEGKGKGKGEREVKEKKVMRSSVSGDNNHQVLQSSKSNTNISAGTGIAGEQIQGKFTWEKWTAPHLEALLPIHPGTLGRAFNALNSMGYGTNVHQFINNVLERAKKSAVLMANFPMNRSLVDITTIIAAVSRDQSQGNPNDVIVVKKILKFYWEELFPLRTHCFTNDAHMIIEALDHGSGRNAYPDSKPFQFSGLHLVNHMHPVHVTAKLFSRDVTWKQSLALRFYGEVRRRKLQLSIPSMTILASIAGVLCPFHECTQQKMLRVIMNDVFSKFESDNYSCGRNLGISLRNVKNAADIELFGATVIRALRLQLQPPPPHSLPSDQKEFVRFALDEFLRKLVRNCPNKAHPDIVRSLVVFAFGPSFYAASPMQGSSFFHPNDVNTLFEDEDVDWLMKTVDEWDFYMERDQVAIASFRWVLDAMEQAEEAIIKRKEKMLLSNTSPGGGEDDGDASMGPSIDSQYTQKQKYTPRGDVDVDVGGYGIQENMKNNHQNHQHYEGTRHDNHGIRAHVEHITDKDLQSLKLKVCAATALLLEKWSQHPHCNTDTVYAEAYRIFWKCMRSEELVAALLNSVAMRDSEMRKAISLDLSSHGRKASIKESCNQGIPSRFFFTSAIELCAKTRNMEDIETVFNLLLKLTKDNPSYKPTPNTLFFMCRFFTWQDNDLKAARLLKVFKDDQGVIPTADAYRHVCHYLAKEGHYGKAEEMFLDAKQVYGIKNLSILTSDGPFAITNPPDMPDSCLLFRRAQWLVAAIADSEGQEDCREKYRTALENHLVECVEQMSGTGEAKSTRLFHMLNYCINVASKIDWDFSIQMTRALQSLGYLPSEKVVNQLVDSGVEGGRYIKAASLMQDLAAFKKKQEEQKKDKVKGNVKKSRSSSFNPSLPSEDSMESDWDGDRANIPWEPFESESAFHSEGVHNERSRQVK